MSPDDEMTKIGNLRRKFILTAGRALCLALGLDLSALTVASVDAVCIEDADASAPGLLVWVIVQFPFIADWNPAACDFAVTLSTGSSESIPLPLFAIAPNQRAVFYGHFQVGLYTVNAEAYPNGRTFLASAPLEVEAGYPSSVQLLVIDRN